MRFECAPTAGKEWSDEDRKSLLEYYVEGMLPFTMAQLFGCKVRDVVRELSQLVLGVDDAQSDSSAPNYGRPWDWYDDYLLTREYQLGSSLERIAALLGRDLLGVAFKMLDLRPPIPPKTSKKYGLRRLSKAQGPLEGDRPEFIRLCSTCHDVPMYCRCPYEDDRVF